MGPQSQHWQARSPQLWNVSVSSSPFDCFRGTFARRVLLRYDITTTDLWRRRQTGIQCDKNFGASLGRFVVVIYWLALETTTTTYAPRHLIGTVVSSDRFFAAAQKRVESFFKREFSLVCDEDVYRSRRKPRIYLHATYSLQITATPEVRTARPQDETACPVLATCCLSLIQGRLSLIDYLLMYIFDKNIIKWHRYCAVK